MNGAAPVDNYSPASFERRPLWFCDVCSHTRDVRVVPGPDGARLCQPCRVLFAPLWTLDAGDLAWWTPRGNRDRFDEGDQWLT